MDSLDRQMGYAASPPPVRESLPGKETVISHEGIGTHGTAISGNAAWRNAIIFWSWGRKKKSSKSIEQNIGLEIMGS